METINNAIASVTSAIYGTTSNETGGTEPVSGQKGAGTATDPYDKGNDPALNPSTKSDTTTGTEHSQTSTDSTSSKAHSSAVDSTSGHSTSDTPTSAPSVTGPGPVGQSRPDAGSSPGVVRPTEANENRPNQNAGGFGTAEPSVSADPASGQTPQHKQQGADKPLDSPSGKEVDAVKEDKEGAEAEQRRPRDEQERQEFAEKGLLPHDPNDHSGEPMKMHSDSSEEDVSSKQADRKQSVGQEGGDPHGSAKGTGDEWVKTSGFATDGGDFDATKPGAGKEATRLQEEKGIHHEPGTVGSGPTSNDDGPEKTSKLSRLKEKLHIGTGKNLDK